MDPHSASPPVVADFLLFLFHKKGFSTNTIEGYRSAIAASVRFSSSFDIGKDPSLTSLIHSLQRERPRRLEPIPQWDLSLILWTLTTDRFEPLSDPNKVPLKELTLKTVFLILLASGARRSEVHSFSFSKVGHSENWSKIFLFPISKFICKTFRHGQRFESVTIPALTPVLCRDMTEERTLCPVRALKIYLARTQHMREGKDRLFISFLPGHSGDIHMNTISGWIRKLIFICYDTAHPFAAKMTGTSTHAIRGMAASMAYSGSVDIQDILNACSWKSHNTFTSHYLKDISIFQEGLLRVGPVVAAQRVVPPRTS